MTKIEELRAAFNASTRGTWVQAKPMEPNTAAVGTGTDGWLGIGQMFGDTYEESVANAEFIALAHNLMPTLLEAAALLPDLVQYAEDATLEGDELPPCVVAANELLESLKCVDQVKDPIELRNKLRNFTGTETWWCHGLNHNMLYTDGVKFFAENASGGAYWFLDIVATEIWPLQKREEFINIALTVKDSKAVIEADDGDKGSGRVVLFRREIDFTDCPEGEWRFWLTNNVMLLPSEY